MSKLIIHDEQRKLIKYINELETDLKHVHELNNKLDKIAYLLEESRVGDVLRNYNNPRRVLMINLLAGLARGLGLTVGTAIVLGLAGYVLSHFLSIPIIGDYVSDIISYVEQYGTIEE